MCIRDRLCNVLDPGIAVALSSVSNELRTATRVPLQQLKTDHGAAAALCHKLWVQNCKALREAKVVICAGKGLTADELKLLGTLGSVLPALETLSLIEPKAGPDGVRQLAEGLGAGALPAVTFLRIIDTRLGDAGASALAAALGQGALPRLKHLALSNAIGDAGLVATEIEMLQHGPPPQGRCEGHQPRVADGGVEQMEVLEPRQGALSQGGGGNTEIRNQVTAGSAPARSPAASCCTPSGPAAGSWRPSSSSAGSTEPSVPTSARSSEE